MKRATMGLSAASLILGLGLGGMATQVVAAEPTLSEEQFEHAKKLYFQRCAGCGGRPVLRVRRYLCGRCGADVASHFLFDALVFYARGYDSFGIGI